MLCAYGPEQTLSAFAMLAGAAAMAGHIWPVWLRFRGGWGAATAVSIIGVAMPGPTLLMALPTALVLLITRNTSLGFGVIFLWSLVIGRAFSMFRGCLFCIPFGRWAAISFWFPHLKELSITVAAFWAAYFVYLSTRHLVYSDHEATAMANASRIVELERRMGLFWEPAWQEWAMTVAPPLSAICLAGVCILF